jgi:hypothetical protein
MSEYPSDVSSTFYNKPITYKMILANRRAVMALISVIAAMIIMLFFESILSIRLTEMGIDEDYVGKFT